MAKQKKKRNKQYTGPGAANIAPKIIRVDAVRRNKAQLWWLERKRFVKPALIATLVIVVVAVLLYELARIIFFRG